MTTMARVLAGVVLAVILTTPATADWISVKDLHGGHEVCLRSGGRDHTYQSLDNGDAATCQLSGPRRLKFVARYLFDQADDSRVPYTVIVEVDGKEVLRKAFTGKPLAKVSRCRGEGRVASLRRGYVNLPQGRHEVAIRVETAGRGAVGLRLYRQVKRQRDRWMWFSAETDDVRKLEFASGTQSNYYHFDADTPLRLEIGEGPTTLRVRTRLDFDHTMNGSQTYAMEVFIDGESWRTFHFDTTKLASARWLENPDILPGDRKEFRIPVNRGPHTVEIHCVRPEACGVAAMIHIPESDLKR